MRRIPLIITLSILVFTCVSCSTTDHKSSQPFIPPDETELPVEAFGRVKATDVIDILLPFPAVIEKIHVTEGQRVKAGDVLVSINMTDYLKQIKEKEMEIKKLHEIILKENQIYQGELDQFNNNSHPDMKKLQYNLIDSKEEHKRMEQKLTDKIELFNFGAISLKELTELKDQVDDKNEDVKEIELSIDILKYQKQKDLEKLQDARGQNTNRYELLTAELDDMSSKLDISFLKNSSIVAVPDNGIVCEIGYIPGAYINPYSRIIRIMDLNSLAIEANIDEQFISKVKKDAGVQIIPEADRNRIYTGKVTFISSMANSVNGETTIPVMISIEDPDDFLFPNLNVEVLIDAQTM